MKIIFLLFIETDTEFPFIIRLSEKFLSFHKVITQQQFLSYIIFISIIMFMHNSIN